MSLKFLVLGGGYSGFWGRGGCRFYFYGREDFSQEDVNGEKLTVKNWWIFGADFFAVWCRFFHGLRRFFTVCKGHKR